MFCAVVSAYSVGVRSWTASSHLLGQCSLDYIHCNQLILSKNWYHQISDFKDKMHQIRFLLRELTALLQIPSSI